MQPTDTILFINPHIHIHPYINVRTQFVTIPNWSWVRTLNAQIIKFVERGLKG